MKKKIDKEIEEIALKNSIIASIIDGKPVKKVIVIKSRLVNVIV